MYGHESAQTMTMTTQGRPILFVPKQFKPPIHQMPRMGNKSTTTLREQLLTQMKNSGKQPVADRLLINTKNPMPQ